MSPRRGSSGLYATDQLELHWLAVVSAVDGALLSRQDTTIRTSAEAPLTEFLGSLAALERTAAPASSDTARRRHDVWLLGKELSVVVQRVVSSAQQQQWGSAQYAAHTELSTLTQRFLVGLRLLRADARDEVTRATAAANRSADVLTAYWVVTSGGIIALSIAFGVLMTRRVTRPVNVLLGHTERVAAGDFTAIQPIAQNDEIGRLSRAFSAMTDELGSTYATLVQRVDELQDARDSLRRSTDRLEAVVTLDRAILAQASPDAIAREALAQLRRFVPASRATVTLVDERGHEGVLAVAGDARGAQRRAGDAGDAGPEDASTLVEPLIVGGAITGALTLYGRNGQRFSESDVAVAREVAAQLAIAVQQARLVDELQRYASELEIRVDELWHSEERFRTLVEAAPDAIVILDEPGHVVLANSRAAQLFGCSPRELVGRELHTLIALDGVDPGAAYANAPRECIGLRRDGTPFPAEMTTSRVEAPGGVLVTRIIRDVTERKRFEDQLRYLADHDSLTGLLNRRRFERELCDHLSRVTGSGGPFGAVLLLDLDNLKYVNDSLGHSVGDDLITSVGNVLRQRLRSTDVLARLGGDEFAVLLPTGGQREALRVAENLLTAVRTHNLAGAGHRVQTTTSIGIAIVDEADATAAELLIAADLAMYEAKEAGRNQVAVFAPARRPEADAPLAWSARIRHALDGNGFQLFVQPILDLATGDVTRYEALVRIVDGGTVVTPNVFLPVAERFGLMTGIDRWVVRRAIELLGDAGTTQRDVVLEVNLSGTSLTDRQFLSYVAAELADADVDPSRLIFEITETAAIANMNQAATFARDLARLGCRFALDDFGAGFASFYYLKHLPLSYLKLDGDFVRDLPHNATDQLVVRAMVEVARGLEMRTIAEFVGDAETVDLLRDYGVDYAQGYYVGKPVPAETLLDAAVRR
jgi:diguanylate cyclase (GGDEF)-like protein/PAS domain S-box-containing protein